MQIDRAPKGGKSRPSFYPAKLKASAADVSMRPVGAIKKKVHNLSKIKKKMLKKEQKRLGMRM